MNLRCFLLAFAMAFTTIPWAMGDEAPAMQDDFLERYAETYRFTHGRPAAVSLTPSGDAIFYLRSGPRSFVRDLFAFDPATGEERVLLTAEQLLGGGTEELTAEEKARRERMRLAARGIASYEVSHDGQRLLVGLRVDAQQHVATLDGIVLVDDQLGDASAYGSGDAIELSTRSALKEALCRRGSVWHSGGHGRHREPPRSCGDLHFVVRDAAR